jgi:type I restriction-modification system DNA methylase subunit
VTNAKSREALVERELYRHLMNILENQNFKVEGVEFCELDSQKPVNGGYCDLLIPLSNGSAYCVIECKRKIETTTGFKEIRDFNPLSGKVIDQALNYAVKLGASIFGTTNGQYFALFEVPERGTAFRLDTHRLLVKEIKLVESDIKYILEFMAKWQSKQAVARTAVDWTFIITLRGFVDYLSKKLIPVVRKRIEDSDFKKALQEHQSKVVNVTVETLAREAAYIFMNKIIFYKVLERRYDLQKLEPLVVPDSITFLSLIQKFFMKAAETTNDFEPVFFTGIYDLIPLPSDDVVLDEINALIEDMDKYRLEEIRSDIVGFIYENLIPEDERHMLGQFYTPPQIAELITKWAIRSMKDIILDPACGSGTFLVKAYNLLRGLSDEKDESLIHKKILSQIYCFDIDPFPGHLTALNLAMRDVRYPYNQMNIIVEDAFKIEANQKVFTSYTVKTAKGELRRKITIPKVNAVVANPPYTRWIEIPDETKIQITKTMDSTLKSYKLSSSIQAASEIGIYIYFIIHATSFLKEGGRLGMIISNTWLQTDYGIKFTNYILDHYDVRSIIDFSSRQFRIPLISTCVLLLEKNSNPKLRHNNKSVFIYVDKEITVNELLDVIENPSTSNGNVITKCVPQSDLPRDKKWIQILFNEDIEKVIFNSDKLIRLQKHFHIYRGNTGWAKYSVEHSLRPNPGPENFFNLTDSDVKHKDLKKYAHPALTSVKSAKFFTFSKKDWKATVTKGSESYFFICNKPKSDLDQNTLNYIRYGETECKTKIRKSRGGGKICSQTWVCQERARRKKDFVGWYDLKEVVSVPIFGVYHGRYKTRFVFLEFPVALYHNTIALKPKKLMHKQELMAILAYLNSSFTQVFIERHGVPASVGPITLEISQAAEIPILDTSTLTQKEINSLAILFDELEDSARRIGSSVGKKISNLQFVIDKIDLQVCKILGLSESNVSLIRKDLDQLIQRRLSGAAAAKPDMVKGEEIPSFKIPSKVKINEGITPLDRWIGQDND